MARWNPKASLGWRISRYVRPEFLKAPRSVGGIIPGRDSEQRADKE